MKKIFSVPNILMFVQILLSAIITVILVLYKPFEVYVFVLLQISAVIGILGVRFAFQISKLKNRFGDYLRRESEDALRDEFGDVSRFYKMESEKNRLDAAIFFTKLVAYLFISVQIVFLFI